MNIFGVKVQRNFSDECVASACDRSNNISLTDNLIAATLAREHNFFPVKQNFRFLILQNPVKN